MAKRNVDMLQGSIFKGLISLTIPIMIANVMQSMFNVVDMTVLGKLANDSAVGAVGVCSMLITLCTGLLIGVSLGANVIVAKHIGAGDRQSADKAAGTALLFAILGSLVVMVMGISCAEIFLGWMNCPPSLLPKAVLYFRLYFVSVPMLMVYNTSAAILRAIGDSKRPMYFLLTGGITKVVLNILIIKCFNVTVEGVGIASIISNSVAGGLAFLALTKNKDKITVGLRTLKIDLKELKKVLFVGIPAGMQSALYSLANVVITTAVNGFGENATTGISIANQFDAILYNISCATSYAATPYIAQNLGAGNIKRAKKTLGVGILITIGFGASLGALSAIFSRELSQIMSTNPEVIRYSCQKMVLISSTYFLSGIYEVMCGALRGLGKPIIPTVATLVFMCLIRFVWVYLIFPLMPPDNLTFLFLIWPIGWVLAIITMLIVYFPTIRKLERK